MSFCFKKMASSPRFKQVILLTLVVFFCLHVFLQRLQASQDSHHHSAPSSTDLLDTLYNLSRLYQIVPGHQETLAPLTVASLGAMSEKEEQVMMMKWETKKGEEEEGRRRDITKKIAVKMTENLLPPGVSMDHFRQFLRRQQQKQQQQQHGVS